MKVILLYLTHMSMYQYTCHALHLPMSWATFCSVKRRSKFFATAQRTDLVYHVNRVEPCDLKYPTSFFRLKNMMQCSNEKSIISISSRKWKFVVVDISQSVLGTFISVCMQHVVLSSLHDVPKNVERDFTLFSLSILHAKWPAYFSMYVDIY